jgi:hypothetical protein
MSITVITCHGCERLLFPRPLVCPCCHGTDLTSATAEHAVVEQVTSIPGKEHHLATVAIAGRLRVVARVPAGVVKGDSVPLSANPIVDWAAYVPQAHDEHDVR